MEILCKCERWIIEVEPGFWAHSDDMLVCKPVEPVEVVYLGETA